MARSHFFWILTCSISLVVYTLSFVLVYFYILLYLDVDGGRKPILSFPNVGSYLDRLHGNFSCNFYFSFFPHSWLHNFLLSGCQNNWQYQFWRQPGLAQVQYSNQSRSFLSLYLLPSGINYISKLQHEKCLKKATNQKARTANNEIAEIVHHCITTKFDLH